MKLWPRERIERATRRLILTAALISATIALAGSAGFFDLSKDTIRNFQSGWVALFWIKLLLDARARRLGEADPGLNEPSPAVMLTILIVLTGAAAVFSSLKGGPDASAHVPYLILIGTMLLALLGTYLASRYRDQIGEARFKSPSNSD